MSEDCNSYCDLKIRYVVTINIMRSGSLGSLAADSVAVFIKEAVDVHTSWRNTTVKANSDPYSRSEEGSCKVLV